MKIPGTRFTWIDDSGKTAQVQDAEVRPLFLAASSFDKGPENMMTVYGNDFYKLFGVDQSFVRHGQPAIQIANGIDNGAEYLVKRIVAPDATLANLVITASVSQGQANKVDQVTGEQIYLDADTGEETTKEYAADGTTANEAVVINTAMIKYDVVTVEDCKTEDEIKTQAAALLKEQEAEDTSSFTQVDEKLTDGAAAPDGTSEGDMLLDPTNSLFKVKVDSTVEFVRAVVTAGFTYPLFAIADNGRGVSSKKFNITTDPSISKTVKFAMYKLNFFGAQGFDEEYVRFSCDPDRVYLDKNMGLSETGKDLIQISPMGLSDSLHKFLKKVAECSGMEEADVYTCDVLFGRNIKGEKIQQISIDTEGYQLDTSMGLMLQSGTNGSFGDAPFGTEAYTTEMVKFFKGELDDTIFDVDRHKIEACIDANYPSEVKHAIADLCEFRQDFFFYRDLGLNHESFDAIKLAAGEFNKSKFYADYITTYDIIDKFSKKQIPVTMLYSVTRLLINHYNSRRNTPECGLLYDWTIPEAIEGTVNFSPKITPYINQKEEIVDAHLNYAIYINNVLTVETQTTSQMEETQCSYISNIVAVQEVIRAIRTLCPRIRGSFIDKSDGLERYAQDVSNVIDKYRDNFTRIEFSWSADEVMLANKTFDAVIKVAFKDYVIAEEFTIYTVDNN